MSQSRMKVLLASSEVHPFSKTGGLADMVGALAKSLAQAGVAVDLVTPFYKGIKDAGLKPLESKIELPLGARMQAAKILAKEWEPGLTLYFVDAPEFFQRDGLYGEKGTDYPDNADRFIFLSKCAAHLARYLPEKPEIVHAHDWQVGLLPLLVLHQSIHGGWGSPPGTCLTIHNLAYQGLFPADAYALTNLPRDYYFHPEGVEFHGLLNCLKAGICYADRITTVSPRYAREIVTEAFGCGLDGVLRRRKDALTGILNGVDYTEWRTEPNPYLRHPYSLRHLEGKTREKLTLQAELGLPPDAGIPLFGNVTRLVHQKGSDILLGALEEMLSASMQFALLGSGDPLIEKAYKNLARRYPDKVAVRIGYDHALSHRIEAGSDFFVMPSRFEPCGLNQMYSLRYGTIPIVRVTGGLDDSVIDPNEDPDLANGIKFQEASTRALAKAIRKALVLFSNPDLLEHFRENGMAADFSWNRTTTEYLRIYDSLAKKRPVP
jgi:starch synthase